MTAFEHLDAGPDLDRLVAERVMRWRLEAMDRRYEAGGEGWSQHPARGVKPCEGEERVQTWGHVDCDDWRPSRNIADAWHVVDLLREDGWDFEVALWRDYAAGAAATFSRSGCGGAGRGGTVELAICRAALQARDT